MTKAILIMTVILLNVFIICAADYPRITPFVNDFADLLSASEESALELMCSQIEKSTGFEVVVLTVESTEGEGRTMYANHVGEENGVGKSDESNGLIVMWSLDNEKGGGIAVGRGAESTFNDAKVGRIGRDARPLFDDEKYYDGFHLIVSEIAKELNSTHIDPDGIPDVEVTPGMIVVLVIFIVVLIVLWILFPDFFLFALILHMLMPRRGGSGGVSFGGGSFGGGGSDF